LNQERKKHSSGKEKYDETVGRPSKESLSTIDNDLPKHNTRKKHSSGKERRRCLLEVS
jgi:hypothetical protein